VKISFDRAKNERNITLRGLSFDLVADLDWDSAIIREDTRRIYGEARFRVLGFIGNRLHMAVFTPRNGSVRVISLRRASRKEIQQWLKK
jgi:uncharacterized protein